MELDTQRQDKQTLQDELECLEEEIELLEGQMCATDNLERDKLEQCLAEIGIDEDLQRVQLFRRLGLEVCMHGVPTWQRDSFRNSGARQGDQSGASRRALKGFAHDMAFELQLLMQESQDSTDQPAAMKLSKMEVAIDGDLPENVLEALERAEESCCIVDFFWLFVPYAQWVSARQRTFAHFAENYKTVVRVPQDQAEIMQMVSPSSSVVWTIHWTVLVSDCNSILPLVQLYVQAPKTLAQADKTGLMEAAPARFQQMLGSHGIKKAIETILEIVLDTM